MVTTGDVLTRDALQRFVRERAQEFDIPDTELEVNTYHEPTRNTDVVRVHFRTPDKMEKYQGEVACDLDMVSDSPQMDLVARQLDDLLKSLEQHWLEEGGNVTFYKNHGFFYRFTQAGGKACLEVQCTVCNHVEMANHPSDILDEKRDFFLMKMLPEAHANCDCAAGRYDSVQRPALHGLTR